MGHQSLNAEEIDIVRQCLRAAAFGAFIECLGFETIMELNRYEAERVAPLLPDVDELDDDSHTDSDVWLVIDVAMANLIGPPHATAHPWGAWVSASVDRVADIFERFRCR